MQKAASANNMQSLSSAIYILMNIHIYRHKRNSGKQHLTAMLSAATRSTLSAAQQWFVTATHSAVQHSICVNAPSITDGENGDMKWLTFELWACCIFETFLSFCLFVVFIVTVKLMVTWIKAAPIWRRRLSSGWCILCWLTLYCITLHYITLHYTTLHYTTLHYIT